ncbi:hypothetical protein SprV_0501904700 [Sparganum proliferum]
MAMDGVPPAAVGGQTQSISAETPMLQPSSMLSRTGVHTGPLYVSHTATPIPQIAALRQGTPRPVGVLITRPFYNQSHQTIHQAPPLIGRGTPVLINTCPGPSVVSTTDAGHAPSGAVSVSSSPRPLVWNALVGSCQQRESTPLSSSTSTHTRSPVIFTAAARPTSETIRLPYNVILSAPISTTQVWPRGSTILISKAPLIHSIPLSTNTPTAPRLPSSSDLSAPTGCCRPAHLLRLPNSSTSVTLPSSPVPTTQPVRVPTCSGSVPSADAFLPATPGVCMDTNELPIKRTQKITRLPANEPTTSIFPPTRRLTTDKATTVPMSFLPIAPKRFRSATEDFDRPLILVNTVREDRLPMEETCPLPITVSYPPVENPKVVVETSTLLHAATVFIQEALETVKMLAPVEVTELAPHAPALEWCISTASTSTQPLQSSPDVWSPLILVSPMVQQPLKRKRRHARSTTATSGVVEPLEPPTKMAHSQFAFTGKSTVPSSAPLFPKPGDSNTSPAEVLHAPSVPPGPIFPIEDLHRLLGSDPPTSLRPVLDTPYPFLHSFNLVLRKIIPRRPLVSSASALEDDTMDVDVDSHRPPVIRPSCRFLASIGRSLVGEQFRAHSETTSHRAPYRKLAGLKAKTGQHKDSSDADNNPKIQDHHDTFPRAREDKVLRTLPFCLSTLEVRHLAWRPKHLGVAHESTCVRRGCPFVADSFFSLSHHLEQGHWLLVSLNQSSQAPLFSAPVDVARTHRIVSRKLLRCGGAASVKYSCPVCSMYFTAAHGVQAHMSKNHGIQNFHSSDACVSVRCWNCGDTTDRNQRYLVCQVAQAEDESARRAVILQQLSSDPARAINAHSMAVYLLCPNPEARFSLPTQLANHLLPVTDVSPLAPSFSLRYTRAISALTGYMQPCLVSSQETGRTVPPAPSEPLILRKFLEETFRTPSHLLDLTHTKTAPPTSQPLRPRPASNSDNGVASSQCAPQPLSTLRGQRHRFFLQAPLPPARAQPFPNNPLTPLPRIAPKPVVFALRPRLPPSSDSQSPATSTADATMPPIYRLVGSSANALRLGQSSSNTSSSEFASFIEAAKRQQQNLVDNASSNSTAVRILRAVPLPPGLSSAASLSTPSTSLVASAFPVPVVVTSSPAIGTIPRASESTALTPALQEALKRPAWFPTMQPSGFRLASSRPLPPPYSWSQTSFNPPVISPTVGDRALPRGPQIVCPICAFTSYERNVIMQHIVDEH